MQETSKGKRFVHLLRRCDFRKFYSFFCFHTNYTIISSLRLASNEIVRGKIFTDYFSWLHVYCYIVDVFDGNGLNIKKWTKEF